MTERLTYDELPEEMPERFQGSLSLWTRVNIHRDGKLIEKGKWEEGHSFVKNFLYTLYTCFGHAYDYLAVNTSGSVEGVESPAVNEYTFRATDAAAANDNYGILLGTDNTAVTLSDYVLGTKIAHGVAATQLSYGAHSNNFAQPDGSNVDLVLIRLFTNSSGGDITVEEMGLVCYQVEAVGGLSKYYLLARDLKNFTITDGDVAYVEYRLRTTI